LIDSAVECDVLYSQHGGFSGRVNCHIVIFDRAVY